MTTIRRPLITALWLLAACAVPQLEDPDLWDAVEPAPPTPPLLASHAVAHHTCALDRAGVVICWGRNDRGQLGLGHTNDVFAPVRVPSDQRFDMVVVGGHTCALDVEGGVHCWGPNDHGQLGDGGGADRSVPTPFDSPHRFARVTAGAAHTCALDGDGRAFCWGDNRWGQLGDGSRTSSSVPVAVAGEEAFSRLSAGSRHTCGIAGDLTLLCWGDNFLGQLGQPGSVQGSLTPLPLPDLRDIANLSAGHGHTCALAGDGAAWCWGQNGIGQLGSGAPPGASGPARVAGVPPLAELRVGYHHTCAVDIDGRGWCWGANTGSEPGAGLTTGQLGGQLSWSNLPVALELEGALDPIAAGDAHTCALTRGGVIFCFGSNRFGQLGRGEPDRSSEPVRVLRLEEEPTKLEVVPAP